MILVVDPQLPQALGVIRQVIKVHRGDDGCVDGPADVNIKGRVYTLVMLPALPSGEDGDHPTTE